MGPCDYSSLQPPAAASPMITHKYLHNTRQQSPAPHEPSFSASDSISRRHSSFWAFISTGGISESFNMQHTFTKCVVSVQTYFYKEHSTQVEMNGQFVYNDTDDYRGCQPATDRTSTALTGLWTPFILTFVIHSSPFVLLIAQT